MGVSSNLTADKLTTFLFLSSKICIQIVGFKYILRRIPPLINSRVAQWKRAGPITQRSVDRNYALLEFFSSNCFFQTSRISVQVYLYKVTFAASYHHDPLAQRIARWTSNPKVLGSIPRWVDYIFRRWYFSKQGI